MKLFVTGGTGFVGSHFLQRALAAGHEVIAQRRPGSRPRLAMTREPHWVDRALDQDFDAELTGCDAVVHLASHTPNPPYAPLDECIYWNVFATVRLLEQAASKNVNNILVAGTYFEYGEAALGQDFIHPSTEMRPSLSYPISKATATTACLGLARQLDLKLKILRIFQVFGQGESQSRFWPSLCDAAKKGEDFAMSSGTQIRDFITVEDVANKFLDSLDFKDTKPGQPEIHNVGSGKAQTLLDFAQNWWSVLNATGKLIPGVYQQRLGELPRMVADIQHIHKC